jgi:hypothetical protein
MKRGRHAPDSVGRPSTPDPRRSAPKGGSMCSIRSVTLPPCAIAVLPRPPSRPAPDRHGPPESFRALAGDTKDTSLPQTSPKLGAPPIPCSSTGGRGRPAIESPVPVARFESATTAPDRRPTGFPLTAPRPPYWSPYPIITPPLAGMLEQFDKIHANPSFGPNTAGTFDWAHLPPCRAARQHDSSGKSVG